MMDQQWIIKPYSRPYPWNTCSPDLCHKQKHVVSWQYSLLAILCYPVKGQLSPQWLFCLFLTYLTQNFVYSHQDITLQLSHALEQPFQRAAYSSASSVCVGRNATPHRWVCHTSKALWDSAWGLPSILGENMPLSCTFPVFCYPLRSKLKHLPHSLILYSFLCVKT